MSWLLSLAGGGNPLRGWVTIGMAVALLLTAGIAWWQAERVAARVQEIGAHKAAYAALKGAFDDERRERLQDRAFAELNAKMQRDALAQAEAQAAAVRIIERKIYVDRPIPVDIETACRPVLDAFNADLAGLRDLVRGQPVTPGGTAAGR